MKTIPNPMKSNRGTRVPAKLMIAAVLLTTSQFLVGCYSYRPIRTINANASNRVPELLKTLKPGKDYEVSIQDGRKVLIKVSAVTTEAIVGDVTLKDAEGNRIYSPSGVIVHDPNYHIPVSGIADIRRSKISPGKTILAIAVPVAGAIVVAGAILSNISGPTASTPNNASKIDWEGFGSGN